jgi:hypothetical protein
MSLGLSKISLKLLQISLSPGLKVLSIDLNMLLLMEELQVKVVLLFKHNRQLQFKQCLHLLLQRSKLVELQQLEDKDLILF